MCRTGNPNLKRRYQEHKRYIKQNDPQSAYTLRILNNSHEYGPINTTMTLLQQITQTSVLIQCKFFYPFTLLPQGTHTGTKHR